jgi:methylaspartate mutase sigma subunit
LLVHEVLMHRPDLVVISSVNGHGVHDGLRAITLLRAQPELAGMPVVIGGKLGLHGELTDAELDRLTGAGYDAVFAESALPELHRMLTSARSHPALAKSA